MDMTETERRKQWFAARAALNLGGDYPDWPDRLALPVIARLHDPASPAGMLAFLEAEASAGRLPTETIERQTQQSSRRVAYSQYLTRSTACNVAHELAGSANTVTLRMHSASAADVAGVVGRVDIGRFLTAWLGPYLPANTLTGPAGVRQEEAPPAASEPLTAMKRKGVIDRLGRKYPALESAMDRPEAWAKECRIPDRRGWYYFEHVERQCQVRYGGSASAVQAADLSAAGQLRVVGK